MAGRGLREASVVQKAFKATHAWLNEISTSKKATTAYRSENCASCRRSHGLKEQDHGTCQCRANVRRQPSAPAGMKHVLPSPCMPFALNLHTSTTPRPPPHNNQSWTPLDPTTNVPTTWPRTETTLDCCGSGWSVKAMQMSTREVSCIPALCHQHGLLTLS